MYYLSFGKQALFITRASDLSTSLQITFNDIIIRQVKMQMSANMLCFHTIVGIKQIKGRMMLLLASEVEKVTSIGMSKIYEIKGISWVAIAPEERQQGILKQLSEDLKQLQAIFQDGFHYYSQNYDLSLPYLLNKVNKPSFETRLYYDQFIWNYNLTKIKATENNLINILLSSWCGKLIQGYVCQFSGTIPSGSILRYVIISRRSYKKAGTRFYARGIDDQGSVANFVETEQVISVGDLYFTHLQIRGSVPAFFAQLGVNGIACEMVIERTAALTKIAFLRHFKMLQKIYGRIFAINLLSEKKKDEKLLSNFYEQLVSSEANNMPYLKYQFYDFHQECKGDKFENTDSLMDKLTDVIEAMGFNCYDFDKNMFVCQQKGVFRTNCLDCLDRTNYVQSRLALRSFKQFLNQYSDQQTKRLLQNKQLLDLPVNSNYPLLAGFNSLWADNGDAISLLYTSIASTHTDITRTGERTMFGTVHHKFKSLMRFYAQFNDLKKHNAINSLVASNERIKRSMTIHDFHTTLLFSFDVFQDRQPSIQSIKQQTIKNKPTLLVFYVFEAKTNTWMNKFKQVFGAQNSQFKEWETSITNFALKTGYLQIGNLKGKKSWMGIFCMQCFSDRVSQVKQQNLTQHASSGEVMLIKMRLQSSTFNFTGINCSNFSEFLTVFDEVHDKGFQTDRLGQLRSTSVLQLDYRVILGHTGSEIKIKTADLDDLKLQLNKFQKEQNSSQVAKIINKVLDCDELSLQESRYQNKYLRQYSQGPLQFIPTGNRMLFWNQEGIILRVRNYLEIGKGGIAAVLDYEVGRNLRMKQ